MLPFKCGFLLALSNVVQKRLEPKEVRKKNRGRSNMDLVSLFVMTICMAVVVIFGVWVCMYVGTIVIITAKENAEEMEKEE